MATDLGGLRCYAANSTFAAHKEWWLKDDHDNYVKYPSMDYTVKAARDWWASLPLLGDGDGTFEGHPVSELIDGVLADGAGYVRLPNVSDARREEQTDGKNKMIAQLQAAFTKANGGVVMANGISMYGGSTADPRRKPDDHNVWLLDYTNGILNEHIAVFEQVHHTNGSLIVDKVEECMQAIDAAAARDNHSKNVFVSTWPGPYSGIGPQGPEYAKAGPEPTPTTKDEWRDALRRHFSFALALYLSVVEANIYWFYGGVWYELHQGFVTCPEAPESCSAPPEWYPALQKSLGPPQGARKLVAGKKYEWTREFEHATVHLNLNNPNVSKVIFH